MQPDAAIATPILLSVKVAAFALPLFAVCGTGLGYVLGRRRTPLTAILDFVTSLPLVFPPIATGFALLLLFGREGPLGGPLKALFGIELIFSFWGVLLAAFIAGLPLVAKTVQASLRADVLRLMEVSAVLGKSPLETFWRVTLPCIKKNVATGLFLALARTWGEVGVTLMLGGNIAGRTNTVSLEIYNAVFTGDYATASILSLILAAASIVCILVIRLGSRDLLR